MYLREPAHGQVEPVVAAPFALSGRIVDLADHLVGERDVREVIFDQDRMDPVDSVAGTATGGEQGQEVLDLVGDVEHEGARQIVARDARYLSAAAPERIVGEANEQIAKAPLAKMLGADSLERIDAFAWVDRRFGHQKM